MDTNLDKNSSTDNPIEEFGRAEDNSSHESRNRQDSIVESVAESSDDYHSLSSESQDSRDAATDEAGITATDEDNMIPQLEEETNEEMEELRLLELKISDDEKTERQAKAVELKNSANTYFKDEDYKNSCDMYTKALKVCPTVFHKDRAILYANRAAAKLKLHASLIQSAIDDCTKAVDLNPSYIKARLRRASALISNEKLDEAKSDLQHVLMVEPLNREAVSMYKDVQEKISDRDKKLQEMFGQLKQLGNMVLRPFGMSTDNFRVNRDPVSSSYSVEFVQNNRQDETTD